MKAVVVDGEVFIVVSVPVARKPLQSKAALACGVVN